jgi:hypothetical protein
MSVGSIGSTSSFWQDDQNYWGQAQAQSQASAAADALINVMGQAEVNQAKGLASIANSTALNRVNSQISKLVQQVLSGSSTSPSSNGSAGSSSSPGPGSSSTSSSTGSPATGIGTVLLTTGSSLSSLGILPGGTITVSAGENATTYTSTGADTVGDLINALNVDLPTNAQVTASLNAKDQLVITSRNETDTIVVEGSGTDAGAVGFGVGHTTFAPTSPSKNPSNSSGSSTPANSSKASSSGANSSNGSPTSSSTSSSKLLSSNLALAEQNVSTAAGILSAAGVAGSLVDLLA